MATETYLEALCAVRDGDKPTNPENILRMLVEKHAYGFNMKNCLTKRPTTKYAIILTDTGKSILRVNGLPDYKEPW